MSFNFGAPSFGTPATNASTFPFGTSTATTKPASGFGSSTFSFGNTATSSAPPSFGLGANTATTAAPTGFGASFGGFGSTTTTMQTPSFGGFGTTATTAATTFSGFGAPATSSAFNFGGFGTSTSATTSTPSLFSGFGTAQPAAGGFGKPFGTATTQSTGLGSFGLGSGLSVGNTFTSQQQQQAQMGATQQSETELATNSVFNCCVFGDEKDKVLAQWNLLQACWGTGKGFYNTQLPPVEYTPRNPFYRFKAIVYSVKPTVEARDGYVALQFNKKSEELRPQQDQMRVALNNLINKPNLSLHVDSIRPLSETSSLVFIYIEEKVQSGQTKKIPCTDLANYLVNNHKQQMINMGVIDVYPFIAPDKDQIQEYLNTPPAGIDATIWRQAQNDNPDPEKFIPVPLLGFQEVRWRYNCQVEETRRHQAFLDQIADGISNLKSQNEESRLKIMEYKHKVVDLEHRILKLMVKQQITRNIGFSLQPEEEILRSQLDSIQSRLNSPQLSGKLSEMLTQIRLHKQEASQQDPDAYNMSLAVQQEIKQFLAMQQSGIKSLMDIMQSDTEDMKQIEAELTKSLKHKV